jgi:hypothetical protein
MTGLRGSQHPPAQALSLSAHTVVYALAAALAITLAVLVLVLAASGDDSGGAEPITVAPSSGPLPPSAAERNVPPGINAPGMRP